MRCYICDFTNQSNVNENHTGLFIKHSDENRVIKVKNQYICTDCYSETGKILGKSKEEMMFDDGE